MMITQASRTRRTRREFFPLCSFERAEVCDFGFAENLEPIGNKPIHVAGEREPGTGDVGVCDDFRESCTPANVTQPE